MALATEKPETTVRPELGLWDTVSIIIGIVIGTSIYVIPSIVNGNLDSPAEVIGVWALGGVLSLLLFRLWTIALTSFAGSLLVAYTALGLTGRLFGVDVAALAERQASALSSGVAGMALTGFFVQFILDRRRTAKAAKAGKGKGAPKKKEGDGGGGGGESKPAWKGMLEKVSKLAS